MSNLVCVFDVGTTGARTIIFDIDGKVISKAYEEYPIIKQPTGISEQNPMIWWNGVKNTCNRAIKSVNPEDVIGISASFQRATSTILDKNGEPLHPALTWMDERETEAKELVKEGGLRRSIPKLLWIKENKPDLFNKTYKICHPDTYIYLKLCNEYVTDPTNGIFGILNLKTLKWDEKLAEFYGLPIDLWPEVRTPGEIIGDLSSTAAGILGLKPNIPVILGGGDQQCSALGLGVVNNGQVKVTTGTGTFVDFVVDEPIEAAGGFPIFSLPAVVKGKWTIEAAIPGTGAALQWFKDNFSQLQAKNSEENNTNIYDMLTEEAKQITPGSEGLLFIPLYIFRKGTIHGLSTNHTRGHMIRAIMESSVLAAGVYLSILEGMARAKATEVRVDGGAMNSELWTQMFADVMNKKIMIPEVKDGAAIGAAILGFYGCGKYNNIDNAIEKMVRFPETKEPIKANLKIYKKLVRIFRPALLDVYDNKRVTRDL